MNQQAKPASVAGGKDDQGEATTVATAETDVTAISTDDELAEALEDTFPASDPINFAGSSAGRSPENAEKPPAEPPIGTHPLGGTEEETQGSDTIGTNASTRHTGP